MTGVGHHVRVFCKVMNVYLLKEFQSLTLSFATTCMYICYINHWKE